MYDTPAFLQGLVLGFGIFICPGPKDILILRQALAGRSGVVLVATGCLSDALLIWLGMVGLCTVFETIPILKPAALWCGVCLLTGHGLMAAHSAFKSDNSKNPPADAAQLAPNSMLSLLAVSFLNPVAWLDAVLILGSIGAALPYQTQLSFGLGAVVASWGWFMALVLGAQAVAHWMTSPRAWRTLDALTSIAMLGLAIQVAWTIVYE